MSPVWFLLGIILLIVIIVLAFLLPGVIGAPYVPSEWTDLEKAFTKLYKRRTKSRILLWRQGNRC